MKSLTTFLAAALVLFAFGQAIAARGAQVPQHVLQVGLGEPRANAESSEMRR